MRKYIILISTVVGMILFVGGIQLLSDNTPPELLIPETPFQAQCVTKDAVMVGVMAMDGSVDITNKVVIENEDAVLLNKANSITYVVSDDSGNVVKKTRSLTYTNEPQTITISQIDIPAFLPNTYHIDTFQLTDYFMATNSCGNIVSEDLYYEGDIDFAVPGDYEINVRLKNHEFVNEIRTITVLANGSTEPEADQPIQPELPDEPNTDNPNEPSEEDNPVVASTPIIQFRQNPITLPLESTFQFMSHIETIVDNIDDFSLLSRRVRVANLPNMYVEGEYTVTYMVTNTNGLTGVGELTVIVE